MPEHYDIGNKDVYDILIDIFGYEAWEKHVVMEAIQYLIRCYRKDDFRGDINKVRVIMERILADRSPKTEEKLSAEVEEMMRALDKIR